MIKRPALCHAPLLGAAPAGGSPSQLRRGLEGLDAGVDLLLELLRGLREPPLLVVRHAAEGVHLLDAVGAEGGVQREEGQLGDGGDHVGVLGSPLACQAGEHRLPEARAGVGHGQRRAALAVLRLHHLGARVLHPLVECLELSHGDLRGHGVLREERQDRRARVAADDGHVDLAQGCTCDLVHELVRPDSVQGRHAADLAGVEALSSVELGHGGHDGVHRVDDQSDDGVGAVAGASLHYVLGDADVDVQQVCAVHSRLPGHPRWHQDQVAAAEALAQVVHRLLRVRVEHVGLHLALPLDVREVCGNAFGRHRRQREVVDRELRDVVVHGHEHGERLADAAGAPADADLEVAGRHRGAKRRLPARAELTAPP
mmetsp:Transcript_46391/g.93626  ORF Transcript_46391/g.93626 Transcript_46391/m.93626 type:complete len:371 (+) Transcript_46391:111-1223(+)